MIAIRFYSLSLSRLSGEQEVTANFEANIYLYSNNTRLKSNTDTSNNMYVTYICLF